MGTFFEKRKKATKQLGIRSSSQISDQPKRSCVRIVSSVIINSNMIESQVTLAYHVEKFYNKQTLPRKASIARRVREVATILNKILNEVHQQEPRFAR